MMMRLSGRQPIFHGEYWYAIDVDVTPNGPFLCYPVMTLTLSLRSHFNNIIQNYRHVISEVIIVYYCLCTLQQ